MRVLRIALPLLIAACAQPSANVDAQYIACTWDINDNPEETIFRVNPERSSWSWWNIDHESGGPAWENFKCDPDDPCEFDDTVLQFGWKAGNLAEVEYSINTLTYNGVRKSYSQNGFNTVDMNCRKATNPARGYTLG